MIDLRNEQLLSFSDAAKLLPRRRSGRRVNTCTLWRWHRAGKAGVRLEAVRLPGGYATTAEAVHRFIAQLTERLDGGLPPNDRTAPRPSTDPHVERELDAAGIK